MLKHPKRLWFTQAIYLHILLNISKHYLTRNGDHLPTVCVACWNFAPQCMKLLCNLTIWPTVLDWCLAVSFLQLRWGHYSVQIGYQREHYYTEIVRTVSAALHTPNRGEPTLSQGAQNSVPLPLRPQRKFRIFKLKYEALEKSVKLRALWKKSA